MVEEKKALIETQKRIYASGEHSSTQILALREALLERGIGLSVLAMPYRTDIRDWGTGEQFSRPQKRAKLASIAIRELTHTGIPVYDLGAIFQKHDREHDLQIWDDDRCHLSELGRDLIGGDVQILLDSRPNAPDGRLLFMGECFAMHFKNRYNEFSQNREATALRAFGDRGRVANLLFLFEDEYLKDCAEVIWLVPYELLASNAMPPFSKEIQSATSESLKVELEITDDHGVPLETFASDLRRMPYPDALIEYPATLPGSGESIVLVGVCAADRKHTGLIEIKKGERIITVLTDLNTKFKMHPDLATHAYYRTVDDFTSRRFFIEEWSKSADTLEAMYGKRMEDGAGTLLRSNIKAPDP